MPPRRIIRLLLPDAVDANISHRAVRPSLASIARVGRRLDDHHFGFGAFRLKYISVLAPVLRSSMTM